MKAIIFLLQKEFLQIFRNRTIMVMIVVMPLMQLGVLPWAAEYEIKNINIAIVDHDLSPTSQRLVNTITASTYFNLTGYNRSFKEAFALIESDEADLILEIPNGFERNLLRESSQKLFIAVNAINGVKANLGGVYLGSIVQRFNGDLQWRLMGTAESIPQSLAVTPINWFNPLLNYKFYMVPGLLAMLVTLIGAFLTTMNIVKEKEAGTIEQVNVTPIRKWQFIVGKLIPFWVLGTFVFTLGLAVSWFAYGIAPEGSLLTLYTFVLVYLLAMLGFGLLVSTFCETQQQAMFILFFFIMIFTLMGGLFTPIESMPEWAQVVTWFNPLSYMIKVLRMVLLNGSSLTDVLPMFGIVGVFAVVLNGLAIWNYRKTA